jgi:hypothetical protein
MLALNTLIVLGILFGLPASLIALHLTQRHREKMRLADAQGGERVAQLEAARADLEARVRALETIVTSGDHDLEARLRGLSAEEGAPTAPPQLPDPRR